MKFTDEQIEYIKNAENHIYTLYGECRNSKTYELINYLQEKLNKISEILKEYEKTDIEDYPKIMEFYSKLKKVVEEE